MSQFLISSTTLTTILVVLSPFIVPKLYRFIKPIIFPSHGGTRTPLEPIPIPTKSELIYTQFRIFLAIISIALLIRQVMKPQKLDNIFISLSDRTTTSIWQRIPILRESLPVKISFPELRSKLLESEGSSGGMELSDAGENLLSYLKSFDARIAYVTYGKEVFDCTWCRPISKSDLGWREDFTIYISQFILKAYAITFTIVSILLEGRRRHRRNLMMVLLFSAGLYEFYCRLTVYTHLGDNPHSQIQIMRNLFFAVVIFISYLVNPKPLENSESLQNLSNSLLTSAKMELVNQINTSSQHLLSIRGQKLQTLAINSDSILRELSNEWWKEREEKAKLINSDPRIIDIKQQSGLSINEGEVEGPAILQMREFMAAEGKTIRIPTFSAAI